MSVLTEVVLRPPKEAFDPSAYRARYGADRYARAQILRTTNKVLGIGAIHLDATASNITMTGSLRTRPRLSDTYDAAVVSQRFDGRDGKPVIIYPIRRSVNINDQGRFIGYRWVCKCPDYLINVLNNVDHKCKHILALEQHINGERVLPPSTLEDIRDMFFLHENVYDSPAEPYYQLRRRRIRDYRANQQRRFQRRRERRLAQLNQIPPRPAIELPWIDERASSLVEPTTLSQGEQNYTRSVARTVDTSRVESDNWHDYTEVEEQEGYAQRQRDRLERGERISRFQFLVERFGHRISNLNRFGSPRSRILRTQYRSFQRQRTPSPPLISTPPSPPRILTPTLPSQMPFEHSPDQPPSQLSPDQPPSQISPVSIPTPTLPFYDPYETIETSEDEEPFSNSRKRGRTSDIQSAPKRQARDPFI